MFALYFVKYFVVEEQFFDHESFVHEAVEFGGGVDGFFDEGCAGRCEFEECALCVDGEGLVGEGVGEVFEVEVDEL